MRELKEKMTLTAQKLRKEMTKEERHLWYDFLKTLPIPVKRQKTIGSYIVDFYIPSAAIIIELDGSQHYEEKGREDDIFRDRYLRERGYHILRFSNREINEEFEAVCRYIFRKLEDPSSVG